MKHAEVFSAVAIIDFELKGEFGRGIKLSDDFYITNSPQPASPHVNLISPWLGEADAELFTKKIAFISTKNSVTKKPTILTSTS